MQITPQSGASTPMDLMPANFLCWVMLTYKGVKVSDKTGSRYAETELTVADNQPFKNKKVFEMVADPDYEGNSEGYRNMGMTSLTRMVESSGIVDVNNPASYDAINGLSLEQVMAMLDGRYVAIKMKIEKGDTGYQDKNKVGDYLSPNPQSSSHKTFLKLMSGDHGIAVNPAAAPRTGFGGQSHVAPQPAASRTGFGAQPAAQPSSVTQPVSQPAQTAPAARTGFDPNKKPAFLGQR